MSAPEEEDRWRLIFLSILPGQPFSDREYALELLRGSPPEPDSELAPRASLHRLLSLLLADQRELKRKLGEEKQRAEQLAQQLQELKEIEKILSEREKKRPVSK
jgi:predicted RNase H-like nuclease (RuvC/YqgF family)